MGTLLIVKFAIDLICVYILMAIILVVKQNETNSSIHIIGEVYACRLFVTCCPLLLMREE